MAKLKTNTLKTVLYYGVGLRRRRKEKTLDIHFIYLQKKSLSHSSHSSATFTIIGNTLNANKQKELRKNSFVLLDKTALKKIHAGLQAKKVTTPLAQFLLKKLSNTSLAKNKNPAKYATSDYIFFALFEKNKALQSIEEAYFKLHLLSLRLCKPHDVSLAGLFGQLPNIAWTNYGPFLAEDLETQRLEVLSHDYGHGHGWAAELAVYSLDKIPFMLNYVAPPGIRIADASRVRLGAYIGQGTTVMPAGFVNFNAGTEAEAMVEGRISSGVLVAAHSDVGGGASIMGTLSGGGQQVISIAAGCLLGANSGLGISLGFGCTVEAGLYLTASSKISLFDEQRKPIDIQGRPILPKKFGKKQTHVVKALQLSGIEKKLFLRDSQTGRIICLPNKKTLALNETLHAQS